MENKLIGFDAKQKILSITLNFYLIKKDKFVTFDFEFSILKKNCTAPRNTLIAGH